MERYQARVNLRLFSRIFQRLDRRGACVESTRTISPTILLIFRNLQQASTVNSL